MNDSNVEPSVITNSSWIGACEKGGQWQRALWLLGVMRDAKVAPDAASYSPAIVALLHRDDTTG